ncbi:nitric oxide reductase NorF protein [Neorhizobium sp. 2083]|uniref:cytochrome C oxidase subunit IV family protein n=1 Tax=Neorhizobium sp. 2083 TaxID=2817762 RepID=UPI000DE127A0|nr:cytochrome C oxidase subunit IV family protein [Neorhizobium sp. 2083]MDR6820718.1 nitric oxide reductase NorF protein [Neorhizobium sp. 2083]
MDDSRLFGSANWVMMLGIAGALIAAQWKHEVIPAVALAVILVMAVAKIRLIVLDFMGLRGMRPNLARALMVWPVFFSALSLGKVVLAAIL